MNAIYDIADGDSMYIVGTEDLERELATGRDEIRRAVEYLDSEYLVKAEWFLGGNGTVSLAHGGIKEIEASRTAPDRPTEHFVPYRNVINITVHGNVTNSPMQVASAGATQSVTYTSDDLGQIRHFVELFTQHEDELDFADDDARLEARAEVATLSAQLDSPKPKHTIIRVTLESLKLLVIGTASSAAGQEMLNLLTHFVG